MAHIDIVDVAAFTETGCVYRSVATFGFTF